MAFFDQNNSDQASTLLKRKPEKQLVSEFTKRISQEKIDPLTNLKLAQFTLVSGKEVSETVLVNKHGLMAQNTLVSGAKTELTGKENLFMSMEMFMTAFGPMTRQTVQEPTSTLMVLCTKVSGKMICNMGKALKPGQIKADMRDNMLLAENTASEVTSGMTVVSIQETGVKIRSVVLVSTHG